MNKIIRLVLIFCSIVYCTAPAYAQECSVSLSGTYKLDPGSEGLYDTFVFDGAGKVGIHAFGEFKGDFFQVGDTVVVYPDKSLFLFLKTDEHTLVGISTWVENQVFKRMENDTIITPMQIRGENYATQFYQYYTLTGKNGGDLSTYLGILTSPTLQASMSKLCDEGFPKACLTMANALMLNTPELAAFLRGSSNEGKKAVPNKEVFEYFVKAIELNELDAIAQLGAYLLMLGHEEEAKKIFEKGCEQGHSGCCLSLAGLEIEWDEDL